ncbi:multicopper oxidase, putative [Talaromyces stipitatus ATCC 10500]|uniref:Multicopper oxidase, putative n=1 Tax=Talaromyces stipitatus (strain ATCC 10500 / CBS 375.48 / QM 6759 / NRRL 1006) TaxID=441959 RepID=B8M170_TALSN|nr:multicopper oxidase, putative [Talaromyces stipitatus ATCC 10500]EED21012.1 multicopper oxidase, putative [Talaromyces stipitatus ATCC 10500]
MTISSPRLWYTLLANLPLAIAIRQPHYILRIASENITVACRTRLSAVVNGTVPGPAIYLKENQTTWVRVYNDLLHDNTTMFVAPYSDGTPQASQWLIKAQNFFDYELRPEIGAAGSSFYHFHVGFQAVTASGPLIVEEADGEVPYDYDEDRMISFSELFNNTDKAVEDALTAPLKRLQVNGNGFPALLGNETDAFGKLPDNAPPSSSNDTCHPEIIQVEPNKTYRFRAIGGVALSPLVFTLEDHRNLTIVAADSYYTQPASTDIIQMGGGQRYDFLLRTKTEDELKVLGKTDFWVQIESRYREENSTFYALLSYTSNQSASAAPSSPPGQHPVSIPYSLQDWMEYTLEPLNQMGFQALIK